MRLLYSFYYYRYKTYCMETYSAGERGTLFQVKPACTEGLFWGASLLSRLRTAVGTKLSSSKDIGLGVLQSHLTATTLEYWSRKWKDCLVSADVCCECWNQEWGKSTAFAATHQSRMASRIAFGMWGWCRISPDSCSCWNMLGSYPAGCNSWSAEREEALLDS